MMMPLRVRITNRTQPNPTPSQVMSLWAHFLLANGWTEFSEIYNRRFAIRTCCTCVIFNFILSVLPTRQLLEFVRWIDDDALRMSITNLK
jgi:hypothetical protein